MCNTSDSSAPLLLERRQYYTTLSLICCRVSSPSNAEYKSLIHGLTIVQPLLIYHATVIYHATILYLGK